MFQMISMAQLEELLLRGGGGFTLLDVRGREEFLGSRLLGAVNIPLTELDENLSFLDRNLPVIVYCSHGPRSLLAARILSGAGFTVFNACGGLACYRGRFLSEKTI